MGKTKELIDPEIRAILNSETPGTDLGLRSRAIKSLKISRMLTEKAGREIKHEAKDSSPSPEHYLGQYRWDSMYAAIMYARDGNPEYAKEEIESLFEGMRPNGMIPNVIQAPVKRHKTSYDPEKKTARFPEKYSAYGQPPLEALAIQETYNAFVKLGQEEQGRQFLESIYPKLAKSLDFFDRERREDKFNPLISVIHPHETGRDSDPTFDFAKVLLPPLRWLTGKKVPGASKLYGKANAFVDWRGSLRINKQNKKANWRAERLRQKFWFKDVMYNCQYADNLNVMSQLAEVMGDKKAKIHYGGLSRDVENAIKERMWDPSARDNKGAFYGIMRDGEHRKILSVSNLFPLCLPNLEMNQLDSLLGQLNDDFNTRWPIPSVGKHEPKFDPHNFMKHRLWRGGVWLNMNWYLVERGLRMQMERPEVRDNPELYKSCSQISDRIAIRSKRMVKKHGFAEFHHPFKGKGQRLKKLDFLWTALAFYMPVYNEFPLSDEFQLHEEELAPAGGHDEARHE